MVYEGFLKLRLGSSCRSGMTIQSFCRLARTGLLGLAAAGSVWLFAVLATPQSGPVEATTPQPDAAAGLPGSVQSGERGVRDVTEPRIPAVAASAERRTTKGAGSTPDADAALIPAAPSLSGHGRTRASDWIPTGPARPLQSRFFASRAPPATA